MAKFHYVGEGAGYQGLPMQDLDSDTLTPEQLTLLSVAVSTGMYTPESGPTVYVKSESEPSATAPEVEGSQETNAPESKGG